jgi:hypothetical protein
VPLVSWLARQPARAAQTDGRIVDGAVRIVDEAGNDLPDGAEGETLARGPAMMIAMPMPRKPPPIDEQGFAPATWVCAMPTARSP